MREILLEAKQLATAFSAEGGGDYASIDLHMTYIHIRRSHYIISIYQHIFNIYYGPVLRPGTPPSFYGMVPPGPGPGGARGTMTITVIYIYSNNDSIILYDRLVCSL